MTKIIGRTQNTNDIANISIVSLNTATSTKILDANSRRIVVIISNAGDADVWIKLQPAATDNDKKGIFIAAGGCRQLPLDNPYTGEISGIADDINGDINITAY